MRSCKRVLRTCSRVWGLATVSPLRSNPVMRGENLSRMNVHFPRMCCVFRLLGFSSQQLLQIRAEHFSSVVPSFAYVQAFAVFV